MFVDEFNAEADASLARAWPFVERPTARQPGVIIFRSFRVYPYARQVLRDGAPLEIGSRAFDLLLTLLRSRGRIVSKDDIFRAVWPSTTVDECNLRFQMTVLRRVLGDDRELIKTIPGRGYLLAGEVDDSWTIEACDSVEDLPRNSMLAGDPGFAVRHTEPLDAEAVRARLAALETENLALRRALSERADDRLSR
jgi:DNA-binding winged helix-turn-helix (wHTH) protein